MASKKKATGLGGLSRGQTARGIRRENQSTINVGAARNARGPGKATTRGGRAIQRNIAAAGGGGGLLLPRGTKPGSDNS